MFDPIVGRILIYGGTGIAGSQFSQTGEVWSFDLASANWALLEATYVTPQWDSAGMFNPSRNRMVIYGGYHQTSSMGHPTDELWELSLDSGRWTQHPVSGHWPSARSGAAAVVNGGTAFLVGGSIYNTLGQEPPVSSDYRGTWKLDLETLSWGRLEPKVIPRDDSYTVVGDGNLQVPAPGLLANDYILSGVEVTGLDAATPPAQGTVDMNADGSFRYFPDAGFTGSDSFTYTVHVGSYVTEPASVRITVSN